MKIVNDVKENLLLREKQLFLTDIKNVFDKAVENTVERGVVGPGIGSAFVQHRVVQAMRERLKLVAIELATIELEQKDLFEIQEVLFKQFSEMFENIMSVPSAWGQKNSSDQKTRKENWENNDREILDKYFGSELKLALNKRSLTKRFNVKHTFLWLIIGALIANIGNLIRFLSGLTDIIPR